MLRWRVEVTDYREPTSRRCSSFAAPPEPEASRLAAVEATDEDHMRLQELTSRRWSTPAATMPPGWRPTFASTRSIYLADPQRVLLADRPAVPASACGRCSPSPRKAPTAPRADRSSIVTCLEAILARKPDLARAAALTLLGNATSDIDRIQALPPRILKAKNACLSECSLAGAAASGLDTPRPCVASMTAAANRLLTRSRHMVCYK